VYHTIIPLLGYEFSKHVSLFLCHEKEGAIFLLGGPDGRRDLKDMNHRSIPSMTAALVGNLFGFGLGQAKPFADTFLRQGFSIVQVLIATATNLDIFKWTQVFLFLAMDALIQPRIIRVWFGQAGMKSWNESAASGCVSNKVVM
jgi:hypothetical protein